jgi:hypothetical protein
MTASVTPSISVTPSVTFTPTVTPSVSVTPPVTVSVTPPVTVSVTPPVTVSVTPPGTPPGTPPVTPSVTPPVTPTTTPSISVTPAVTPTRTPSETPPQQGFAIDVYGRGASTSAACFAAGVPTVYVALQVYQTDYNSGGFASILGVTLYENIYLSSTVADAYASDTYGNNVHSLSAGTVGSFVVGC